MEPGGNFRDEATGSKPGANVIYLPKSVEEAAASSGLTSSDLRARLDRAGRKLLDRRGARVRPHLNDKVLAGWNGLMIGSLAYAGCHLSEPRYTWAAERAADFVLTRMRKDGRLLRTSREGDAGLNAFLEDYVFVADGLLDLHDATDDARWLDEARVLMDIVLHHFRDDTAGGFFFTSDDHEALVLRLRDVFDKAVPSGNGVAARVLVRLGLLTGEEQCMKEARRALDGFIPVMQSVPHGTQSLLLAAAMCLDELENRSVRAGGVPRVAPEKTQAAETPDARAAKKPVTAEAFASHLKVAPGRALRVAVRLSIEKGWHVNSNAPLQSHLEGTSLTLEEHRALMLGEVVYPQGKTVSLASSPGPLSVYEGEAWIVASLMVAADAGPGPVSATLKIRVQPSNDRECLAPQILTLSVPVEVDPDGTADESRHP